MKFFKRLVVFIFFPKCIHELSFLATTFFVIFFIIRRLFIVNRNFQIIGVDSWCFAQFHKVLLGPPCDTLQLQRRNMGNEWSSCCGVWPFCRKQKHLKLLQKSMGKYFPLCKQIRRWCWRICLHTQDCHEDALKTLFQQKSHQWDFYPVYESSCILIIELNFNYQ